MFPLAVVQLVPLALPWSLTIQVLLFSMMGTWSGLAAVVGSTPCGGGGDVGSGGGGAGGCANVVVIGLLPQS